MINRRSLLTGLIAAPFVVRSGVLMPLRGIIMPEFRFMWDMYTGIFISEPLVANFVAYPGPIRVADFLETKEIAFRV